MSQDNPLDIPWRLFPNSMGLDHDGAANGWPSVIKIAEGGVDPRTGGAAVVLSHTTYDELTGQLKHLMDYWRMRPNQDQLKQNLFDFEFTRNADNDNVTPKSLWVMGRKLYTVDNDDLFTLPPGLLRNVNRARSAVQHIHHEMRQEGRLPQIAKIFEQTGLRETMGKRLPIIGLKPEGGFDFDVYEQYAPSAKKGFAVPAEVAAPLLGLGVNTIDAHQNLGPRRVTTAVDPRHGTMFVAEAANDNVAGSLTTSVRIDPVSVPEGAKAYALPKFISAQFKPPSNDNIALDELKLLDVDVLKADHTTRMRVIGVINKILHDMRRRGYPLSLDHLTEFDLHDWADETDRPPKAGRFIVESRGGKNLKEIADGYGNRIGRNCTLMENQWTNDRDQIDRIIAVQDIGLELPSIDVANKGAAPDIVKALPFITYLFLTHRHLDHTDGSIVYIAKGYFKGKIMYGSPECIRSLREKLSAFDIPEEYYPAFVPLTGRGWVHIKDKDGVIRMSVGYSTDSTPHTARCTPYIYVARNGSRVLGSYLNPGDARAPEGVYFDKEFFENWSELLVNDDPTVDPGILGRRVTLAEFDITSVRKKGKAPTDEKCARNKGWLLENIAQDKGAVVSQISTNEMGFEWTLRIAAEEGRDVTEFGANIEHTATTANVMGVNNRRLAAVKRQNIQHFLDNVFNELSNARMAKLQDELSETRLPGAREQLEHEIALETRVQENFKYLSGIKNQYKRYWERDKLEKALEKEFGVQRRLGSIRVTRNTKTSKAIFAGPPERRLVLATGTQGTYVEIDSVIYRWSEGRSHFDLSPELKHTARPLKPKDNILIISQTAIPSGGKEKIGDEARYKSNETKQREMVARLVMRGTTVVLSVHNGCEIHGLKPARRTSLIEALKVENKDYSILHDGTVFIDNFPIHASGHGHEDDVVAWFKLVNADITAPQHTDDPQSVQRAFELMDAGNHRHSEQIFESFDRVAVGLGATPEKSQAEVIGRSTPSLIIIEIIRKIREYYGGHIEATRHVKADGQGGLREDGLAAAAKPDGYHRQHFATVKGEVTRGKSQKKHGQRPEPIAFNTMPVPDERRYEGATRPGEQRRAMRLQSGKRLRAA